MTEEEAKALASELHSHWQWYVTDVYEDLRYPYTGKWCIRLGCHFNQHHFIHLTERPTVTTIARLNEPYNKYWHQSPPAS